MRLYAALLISTSIAYAENAPPKHMRLCVNVGCTISPGLEITTTEPETAKRPSGHAIGSGHGSRIRRILWEDNGPIQRLSRRRHLHRENCRERQEHHRYARHLAYRQSRERNLAVHFEMDRHVFHFFHRSPANRYKGGLPIERDSSCHG